MLQLEKIHQEEETIALMSEYHTRSTEYGAVQVSMQDDYKFINIFVRGVKRIVKSECTLSIVVIIFGICATLASTYYNIIDFKGFQFWSPCIQNISLSYELLSL